MGLIKEIITEIVELPDAFESNINFKDDLIILKYKLPYAIMNMFFQIIDLFIVPILFFNFFLMDMNFINSILILITGLSFIFSILQFFYFLFKPVNKYISFLDLLIAETAVGILIASVFKIPVKHL